MKFTLKKVGDRILTRKAQPIEEVNGKLVSFANNSMRLVMQQEKGIGICAPQVGRSLRIIGITDGKYEIMFNPAIEGMGDAKSTDTEGCLSIPNVFLPVERINNISISYLDKNGEIVQKELQGMQARIFQHEFDHLEGLTIFDMTTEEIREKLINDKQYQRWVTSLTDK